jgi:hypothetical protein
MLSDIMVSAFESTMARAGPVLRRSIFDAVLAVGLMLAALVFLLGAMGIALGGVYLLMAPAMGRAGAAFMCAALAAVIGLVVMIWARTKLDQR